MKPQIAFQGHSTLPDHDLVWFVVSGNTPEEIRDRAAEIARDYGVPEPRAFMECNRRAYWEAVYGPQPGARFLDDATP